MYMSQANQRQQLFDLDFKVNTLQVLISKSNAQGVENFLGDLRLEGFHLGCVVEDLRLTVNVTLRYTYPVSHVHTTG